MPRNGSGVYSLPAAYLAVTGDTIEAAQHNTPLEDLESDMNAVRPIVAGGTGGASASAARTALGLAIGTDVQAYSAVLDSVAAGGGLDINSLTELTGALQAVDYMPIYDDSVTANRKISLINMFKTINVLTAESTMATDDKLAFFDATAVAPRSVTYQQFFDNMVRLADEASPAVDDTLIMYDTTESAANEITLANFFKVINGLTADASPDTAADYVVTYDADAGAAKKVLLENLLDSASITVGTEVASTSGTTVDFTSIPAGISRIVVTFAGVSLSGTDDLLVQIGDAGGLETTGYVSGSHRADSAQTGSTSGFVIYSSAAATALYGAMTLYRTAAAKWVASHSLSDGSGAANAFGGGVKTLSATLDRLTVTTTGSNTFDAGAINIQYQ